MPGGRGQVVLRGRNVWIEAKPSQSVQRLDSDRLRGDPAPVRLSVLDVLGREVAALVEESVHPGKYRVSFDASALASGMYVAALTSASQTDYRLMRLMK